MANFMSALSGAVQRAQEEARKEAQRRRMTPNRIYVEEDRVPISQAVQNAEQPETGSFGSQVVRQPMQSVAAQLERSRQLRDSALAARIGLGSTSMGRSVMSFKGGGALVEGAKKYLGTPYKWGGNSPEEGGMDCSGYMVKVYKDVAGIDLPRTTYEQVKQGQAVSKENLQPGDLVFFGSADNVHHVGMYIGNGQYIHEPKTGDVAKISDLNARKDYYGARRYTK